jgi:HAD superfamily hydrolase (TIGR01509 family)
VDGERQLLAGLTAASVIEAVVFDLDGVLVDSEPVWEQVRRAYVARHAGSWQPDSQSRLMGMSTGEWARYLSDELGVNRPADVVADEVVAEMARRYDADLPLMPGAVDAVRRIGARWRLGLASSSPASLIRRVLEDAGLTDAFAVTLSTEDVARGKPDPDVYLTVAQRLGVALERCAAVEDSSNGLRSAAAAGMAVIAVPHPVYPPRPEALALARLTLASLSELTESRVAALSA